VRGGGGGDGVSGLTWGEKKARQVCSFCSNKKAGFCPVFFL